MALARWCAEQNPPISVERWYGRANSFTFEPGREAGRGWVLLRKVDYDKLDLTAAQTLTFSGSDADHVLELQEITVLSAECIVPGAAADPNAIYLIEVVDRRHHIARIPLTGGYKAYNVSNAAGGAYLSATLNSAAVWSWQEIIDDLATILGEDVVEFELPFTPHGDPENLVFDGCSAWESLCRVLDRIACTAVYDPTDDAFSVVRLGVDEDTSLTALENVGRLWDGYCSETVRGTRPEKVRVRFMRRPQPTDGSNP
jgi:hypothetical protein